MITSTDLIKNLPEYDGHELVVSLSKPEIGLRGFISIYRLDRRYPALGATRLWEYKTETEAISDALRLSKLMNYKSALAGLPYTGAKGVLIASPLALKKRRELFVAYAQAVNHLNGAFITGTDVGVDNNDLEIMIGESPYIIGNGIDSGLFTAHGVYLGIKVVSKKIFGSEDIGSRSFAIQGVGKTGEALVKLLYGESSKIYISDVDPNKIKKVKAQYPKVMVKNPSDIHKQKVDIFCPCALSHSLNKKTIAELKCLSVVGAANNQLEEESNGEILRKRNILYAPDVVVNAGGLISVVDQYSHKNHHSVKRILNEIEGIEKRLATIFEESGKKGKSTNSIAIESVKKKINPSKKFEYLEM